MSTTEDTNATAVGGSSLSEGLGPLPEARWKWAGNGPRPYEDAYSAEQMIEYAEHARRADAKEREDLRAAQAAAVMPLIGPLLDAWECCSQACREELPELDRQLRRINRAMEDAEAPAPGPAAVTVRLKFDPSSGEWLGA